MKPGRRISSHFIQRCHIGIDRLCCLRMSHSTEVQLYSLAILIWKPSWQNLLGGRVSYMDLGDVGTAASLSCLPKGVSACGPHYPVNYFASVCLKEIVVASCCTKKIIKQLQHKTFYLNISMPHELSRRNPDSSTLLQREDTLALGFLLLCMSVYLNINTSEP